MARPRTVSLEPDEMIKLGEEMLTWIDLNDPLHLTAWYSIKMGITHKQWDAMQQVPEFLPYYEQALMMIGQKYLDKNSNVREGVSLRWQRSYFRDLRRTEDIDKQEQLDRELEKDKKKAEHQAQLDAQTISAVPEVVEKCARDMIDMIGNAQSERSKERKSNKPIK
jgi:hypothetical protein